MNSQNGKKDTREEERGEKEEKGWEGKGRRQKNKMEGTTRETRMRGDKEGRGWG